MSYHSTLLRRRGISADIVKLRRDIELLKEDAKYLDGALKIKKKAFMDELKETRYCVEYEFQCSPVEPWC